MDKIWAKFNFWPWPPVARYLQTFALKARSCSLSSFRLSDCLKKFYTVWQYVRWRIAVRYSWSLVLLDIRSRSLASTRIFLLALISYRCRSCVQWNWADHPCQEPIKFDGLLSMFTSRIFLKTGIQTPLFQLLGHCPLWIQVLKSFVNEGARLTAIGFRIFLEIAFHPVALWVFSFFLSFSTARESILLNWKWRLW